MRQKQNLFGFLDGRRHIGLIKLAAQVGRSRRRRHAHMAKVIERKRERKQPQEMKLLCLLPFVKNETPQRLVEMEW